MAMIWHVRLVGEGGVLVDREIPEEVGRRIQAVLFHDGDGGTAMRQLERVLPYVFAQLPARTVLSGSQLLERVRALLARDYEDSTIRQYLSAIASSDGGCIVSVPGGYAAATQCSRDAGTAGKTEQRRDELEWTDDALVHVAARWVDATATKVDFLDPVFSQKMIAALQAQYGMTDVEFRALHQLDHGIEAHVASCGRVTRFHEDSANVVLARKLLVAAGLRRNGVGWKQVLKTVTLLLGYTAVRPEEVT